MRITMVVFSREVSLSLGKSERSSDIIEKLWDCVVADSSGVQVEDALRGKVNFWVTFSVGHQ